MGGHSIWIEGAVMVTRILLLLQRVVVHPVLEGSRLLGQSDSRLHGNSTMWVGALADGLGGVVASAMVEVNDSEVVEFITVVVPGRYYVDYRGSAHPFVRKSLLFFEIRTPGI